MTKTTIAYDRQTVNMVFELKRSLPLHEQTDFRISSPDLITRVKDIYLATTKPETKTLAKRLLRAISVLSRSSNTAPSDLAAGDINVLPEGDSSAKKKRMYRGLAVD